MSAEIHRSGFGPAQADCKRCELKNVCLKQKYVEGERPADWQPGGLMVIGEGPGQLETVLGRPFVGASGKLLDALLESAGLDRQKVWVTNATLGQPPPGKVKEAFHDRFPEAIYACLPRLEAEIAEARPRVIVTLGQAAFIAVSGYEVQRKRSVKIVCTNVDCDPATRKLRSLALVCASADCSWFASCGPPTAPTVQSGPAGDLLTDVVPNRACVEVAEKIKHEHSGKCPKCSSSITRLRPRAMKCPTCGGRKTRIEDFTSFEYDFGLIGREGAAGAVFRAESFTSRLDELGVKFIIPTYHPSYCLHPAKKGPSDAKVIGGQYAARVCQEHLEKARKLLREEPSYTARDRACASPIGLASFVADPTKTYAVDIETNSEDGAWACTKITMIGIACVESQEALVIDARAFPVWPDTSSHPMLDELYRFLDDATKRKVFHNGQFDRVVIQRLWGIEVLGVVSDTIIQHHALYPDEEHGLGFCAHEMLDAPHWKTGKRKLRYGEKDDLGGYRTYEDLSLYNARDTRSTALIDRTMRGPRGSVGRLDVENVRAAHDIDVRMQEVSIRMELAGLPVSQSKLREVRARSEAVCREELLEMRQIVAKPPGPKGELWEPSGKDLMWAMYDPSGPLRLQAFSYSALTGQPSTAKEALARMVDQHPFVARLIRYRKYKYILDNYIHGEALRIQPDGRLHPQWKVFGTTTGRWTSSPNFQNWSKGDVKVKDDTLNLRALVEAPPGRRLVGADYAALELRVMADLSADPGLIHRLVNSDENDKLNPEKDLHAYIASKVFGAVYLNGTDKEKKQLRDTEKRIIYGANYGAGAQTILESIYNAGYEGPPITTQLIEAVLATIRKEFPGIMKWREAQVRKAGQTRELRSPLLARRRIFPLADIDVTICYNFGIQSGAADVMNTRLAVLYDRLFDVDPSAVFIAQVHDAIYIECDEARTAEVRRVVEDSLTAELALGGGPKMLYLASAHDAQTWDQAA